MSIVRSSIEWLDESDSMQCEWFLKRMRRNGLPPTKSSEQGTDYEKCVSIIKNQAYPSHVKKFFPNLKKAWSSYKNKNKDGNKSFNFVMDEAAHDELKSLASELKTTRNRTVELLIHKQYNKELKAKVRMEKKQLLKARETKYSLESLLRPFEYKEKLKELDTLKLQMTEIQKDKEALEHRVCDLMVLLDSKNITSMNDDQKIKSEELYRTMFVQ
jgi:hypothetical protein